jgi:hypothetical protein
VPKNKTISDIGFSEIHVNIYSFCCPGEPGYPTRCKRVCILRAGPPRKLGLIPGRCKKYFLFWTACILARSPTQGVSMGNGDNLAVSKAARA